MSFQKVVDGKKYNRVKWLSTGLPDTKDNVRKAEQFRAQHIAMMQDEVTIDSEITMSALVELFLATKKRKLADTTYAAYENKSAHFSTYFRSVKVRQITVSQLNDFLDELVRNGLSKRYVKDIKVILSQVMKYAIEHGVRPTNPMEEASISEELVSRFAPTKSNDDSFFSYDEANLFLSLVKDHPLYDLFYLTLIFGLRREEVLGLRWQDINFRDRTVKICHTVTKGTEVRRYNHTKTESSHRIYPLSDSIVEMLHRIQKQEKEYHSLFGREHESNDYIFKHPNGMPYYPDYPSKAFTKFIKKHPELPQDVTFHGLRTSCVSILVHQKWDVKAIQKWVGHRDLDTTLKIYAKIKEQESKQLIAKSIEELLPNVKYCG